MTQTASEIVVGADGSINVAPVGTAAPTDPTSAYSATWKELGFASEAGVKLHDAKTLVNIKAWQSRYTVRRIVTDHDFTAAFALIQWDKVSVPLAFGGGEVTTPTPGVFRYAPPDAAFLDERTLGIDWQDGDKSYRLIIPRGIVQDAVDTELVHAKESELPIVFGVITDGTVDPWYLLTDDLSFS